MRIDGRRLGWGVATALLCAGAPVRADDPIVFDGTAAADAATAEAGANAAGGPAREHERDRYELQVTLGATYWQHVPNVGRTYEGVLGPAPGAFRDPVGISFAGATSPENIYLVNGVDTTGVLQGGLGSPLILEFVDQIDIVSGGWGAGQPGGTGGLVRVTTRAGTNQLRGSAFMNLMPLQAAADATYAAGAVLASRASLDYQLDLGFELGGPLVEDHLWFHVGFAPMLGADTVTRIVGTNVDRRANGFSYGPGGAGDADGDPGTSATPGCELAQTCESDGLADVDGRGFAIAEEIDRRSLQRATQTYMFTARVDFAATADHQAMVSLSGSPTIARRAGVLGTPMGTQVDETTLVLDGAAQWRSRFAATGTRLEATLGWHHASEKERPLRPDVNGVPFASAPATHVSFTDLGSIGRNPDEPESPRVLRFCTDADPMIADAFPTITNCPVSGYALNAPAFLADTREERRQAGVVVRQHAELAGEHELSAGVEVADERHRDRGAAPNGIRWDGLGSWEVFQAVELGGDQTCVGPTGPIACHAVDHPDIQNSTLELAGFVEDRYQPMPGLEIRAGVRLQRQQLHVADGVDLGIDPITEQPVGRDAFSVSGLAPRVGASWDFTGAGKGRAYGHWGRYIESLPLGVNRRGFSKDLLVHNVFNWETQCGDAPVGVDDAHTPRLPSMPTGCPGPFSTDPGDELFPSLIVGNPGNDLVGTAPGVILVTPGLAPQYQDEVVLGGEYWLGDLLVGASFQDRRVGRVIEDVSVDGFTQFIANPGEDVDTSALAASAQTLAMNDPKREQLERRVAMFEKVKDFDPPRRIYQAFAVQVGGRVSDRMTVLASYTFSRLEGNYPGLFSEDNGQLDPNVSSQYDRQELLPNRAGRLPGDRPHSFKLDGAYMFDLGAEGTLTTGVRLRSQSGTPVDVLGRHAVYGPRETFVLPRGAQGRSELLTQTDLRVEYARTIGTDLRLSVYIDLYNLFDTQAATQLDEQYTLDRVAPIVGGDRNDLRHLKRQGPGGGETSSLARGNLNFAQPTARLAPLTARFGVRLDF